MVRVVLNQGANPVLAIGNHRAAAVLAMATPQIVLGAMTAPKGVQNAVVSAAMTALNVVELGGVNPVVSAGESVKKAANAVDSGVMVARMVAQSAVNAVVSVVMTEETVEGFVEMIARAHPETAITTSQKLSSRRSTTMLSPNSLTGWPGENSRG
ncbi:MAG: hypothetical protein VWZ99_01620 [Aquiluna sp.]